CRGVSIEHAPYPFRPVQADDDFDNAEARLAEGVKLLYRPLPPVPRDDTLDEKRRTDAIEHAVDPARLLLALGLGLGRTLFGGAVKTISPTSSSKCLAHATASRSSLTTGAMA